MKSKLAILLIVSNHFPGIQRSISNPTLGSCAAFATKGNDG